jgi:hypothetical protein
VLAVGDDVIVDGVFRTRYLEEVDPASRADVVIELTDLARPRLLRG